jgi:hypothetical protein
VAAPSRRRSAAARLLGSNPAQGMDVCLLCLYVTLSCVGRGLCDGLITRPEESYRVYCMCDHRNPKRGPMFQVGNKRKINERVHLKSLTIFMVPARSM